MTTAHRTWCSTHPLRSATAVVVLIAVGLLTNVPPATAAAATGNGSVPLTPIDGVNNLTPPTFSACGDPQSVTLTRSSQVQGSCPSFALTGTASPGAGVTAGQALTVTLRATNLGAQAGTDTTFTETVPAGSMFSARASSPGWSCANGSNPGTICTLDVGTVPGGGAASVIFAVQVLASASGTIADIATVGATNGGTAALTLTAQVATGGPSSVTSIDNTATATATDAEGDTASDRATTTLPVAAPSGTASLGDRVWYDADANGRQDAGEPGLSGVTVHLNGCGETDTTTTADDGRYLFAALPPCPSGSTVAVDQTTLPGGLRPAFDLDSGTTAPDGVSIQPLAAGQSRTDVDFGFTGVNSIGDTVYEDVNGNGTQDANEQGIANAVVTATWSGSDNRCGTLDDSTTTATTGPLGSYKVSRLPAGLVCVTGPTVSGFDPTTPITVNHLGSTGPEAFLNADFGLRGTSTIGNRIWDDRNGDGIQQSGEGGVPGVTVTLEDGCDATRRTAVSDAHGVFHFDHLAPCGTDTVTVDRSTLPAGMVQTGDPDPVLDGTATTALSGGETVNTVDFGYQGTGSLGDRVWLDLDGDGHQDPGDPGIAGVAVTLSSPCTTSIVTDRTDRSGTYEFDHLPACDYTVAVDSSTLLDGVKADADLDGGHDGRARATLAAGRARTDVDFGYVGTGSVGDTVYFDVNANGRQDSGERGLKGVKIHLEGDCLPAPHTTRTHAGGKYFFGLLPACLYRVTVDSATLPAGARAAADLDGGSDNTATLRLGAGQARTDVDFGYTGLAVGRRGRGRGPRSLADTGAPLEEVFDLALLLTLAGAALVVGSRRRTLVRP